MCYVFIDILLDQIGKYTTEIIAIQEVRLLGSRISLKKGWNTLYNIVVILYI